MKRETGPVSHLPDPVGDAFAGPWRGRHLDGAALGEDRTLSADVVIVGSGAGGGVCAEILAQAGLSVILVEEGPLRTSRDFNMLEREAYPALYQESAGRKTVDEGIGILQGRAVGGSTLVNWCSSFRTPAATLAHWREAHGLAGFTPEALAPWFERMEARLSVAPWTVPPNRHNGLLAEGAARLGLAPKVIPRNVKGCWNLGYCGMGCPTNAKQSMLVTTIPAAMAAGATLLSRVRAEALLHDGKRVQGVRAHPVDSFGQVRRDAALTLRARHVVVAAGAIGSPALLLRSRAPDPYGTLGARTFLHPVVLSAATFVEAVEPFAGAPQSVYVDDYLWPADGTLGFKLEVPPVHPLLAAVVMGDFGARHRDFMAGLAHGHTILALVRDGFGPDSPGGRVVLDGHGDPRLDYPLNAAFWQTARRAWQAMAEIQFAAGARSVMPVHLDARPMADPGTAAVQLARLPLQAGRAKVVSAHVMGGCAMSPEPPGGVVRPDGGHHQLEGLTVADGSLLPTSLGVNPQLTLYALAARIATGLAATLARG